MTIDEAKRRLILFDVPAGEGGGGEMQEAGETLAILARILAAGSLTLGDMQCARDIAQYSGARSPGVYLFLAAMLLSLKAGNTFLRIEKGPGLLKDAGRLEDGADEAHRRLVDECWPRSAIEAGGELAKGDGRMVVRKEVADGETGWFFARVWASVDAVSRRLREMSAEEDAVELPQAVVDRAVRFAGKGGEFSLNAEQRQAVETVGRRRFTVVTGGPGTGKTTVVSAILRALMEHGLATGENVALLAPTGRAGQRMGESIHEQCAAAAGMQPETRRQIDELSGSTIHATLGGLPPDWKYTRENRLPYKLVIVDESSMVDVHLMKALLEALPDECRLVLLGDKDQLPSVDAGAVLGDAVANFDGRTVVELKTSNRFKGALAECARAVNAGDAQLFARLAKRLPAGGEAWLDTFVKEENRVCHYDVHDGAAKETVRRLALEWARGWGLLEGGGLVAAAKALAPTDGVFKDGTMTIAARELFDWLGRSRILTVVRNGPFGASGINDLVATERFGGRRPSNPLAKAGVPVIVTRNTRDRNLWNGDIGVTVAGPDGMSVLFPRGKSVEVCPVGLLPEHELAYAMTVHKSQGSEFGNVMVVLPDDEEHPLLNRQIVYTGITRAKKRAMVVGSRGALAAALSRKLERDSGIGVRARGVCRIATMMAALLAGALASRAGAQPAYTNHAGNAVAGIVVALDARTATISNATESVRLPLSIFPEMEQRRIAADFGQPRVPAAVKRAIAGAEKAMARSRKRAEKGLCTKEESDAFCAKSAAALKSYLDKQVESGVITQAERQALGH